MGKTNLQTLDGRADMARFEAGGRRDPCCAAQLRINTGRKMHLTPPHPELLSAAEADQTPIQSGSTMFDASVIICTHNPRSDYFVRVLDGLRNQTLPLYKWELLIVDNASRLPLASNWDISWHPTARHILESELGLSWARRRGIQEASADLIIFVDDDNVLDETYLAEAIKIKQEWPFLGVWGSGSIRGDFEVEPPETLREIRPWLPLRELTAPRWSNLALYTKMRYPRVRGYAFARK